MALSLNRRDFLKTTAATLPALSLAGQAMASSNAKNINIGIIGTGNRGKSLLRTILAFPEVRVKALCDIDKNALDAAQDMLIKAERNKAELYSENENIFEKLLKRGDLDAVIIATPWQWHTPMAVMAMEQGVYAGVEVPAALTLDECWQLVDTHEKTNVPCMMLENWSFRQDNLAVLNIIREGLFGDIVHCHCAHSHDCIDHWFFDKEGNKRWGGDFLINRNCDQYPTHSLGPVLSWMDINCGDNFKYITSTASASIGINDYFIRKFGKDHPYANFKFKQGDIVTSTIKTHNGKTIIINYDMQLPRPYDNRWLIQGTRGLYNEQRNALYIVDKSPEYHKWEPFPPYMEKYDHFWYKQMQEASSGEYGHNGTDYLELKLFFDAVKGKSQTPIDVYDSVSMSCVVHLSEMSIANDSMPVECPDFTRGKWKTRKPTFAVTS